jgi:hypothetical protein
LVDECVGSGADAVVPDVADGCLVSGEQRDHDNARVGMEPADQSDRDAWVVRVTDPPHAIAFGLPNPFQIGGLIVRLRGFVQRTQYSQLAQHQTAVKPGLLIAAGGAVASWASQSVNFRTPSLKC